MLRHLQIYDRRERALVGGADAVLGLAAPLVRAGRGRSSSPPRRVLLLRLERIGDLLMTLDAIADVRAALPDAEIDLVVGSWNAPLAARIPGVTRVEAVDAGWLARDGGGLGMAALLRRARWWSRQPYDLAINFEPDIRSNLLLAASRARRTAGFRSGGGGALLDVALAYDPTAHTADNTRRVVAAVLDVPARTDTARLEIAPDDRRRGRERIGTAAWPLVGMHVSGGRVIKQWDLDRFASVGARAAHVYGATIVLTGSAADRPLVDTVRRGLPAGRTVDLSGVLDLPSLAGVLSELDAFVTGDTGPMHLAAAVGTPVVAVFGPSDPRRYAPRDPMHTIVRIDLPCSPCNRIRLPPARCTGHTPDCLAGIDVEMVFRALARTLERDVHARVRPGAAQG